MFVPLRNHATVCWGILKYSMPKMRNAKCERAVQKYTFKCFKLPNYFNQISFHFNSEHLIKTSHLYGMQIKALFNLSALFTFMQFSLSVDWYKQVVLIVNFFSFELSIYTIYTYVVIVRHFITYIYICLLTQ